VAENGHEPSEAGAFRREKGAARRGETSWEQQATKRKYGHWRGFVIAESTVYQRSGESPRALLRSN
jgi:hypothetical protein